MKTGTRGSWTVRAIPAETYQNPLKETLAGRAQVVYTTTMRKHGTRIHFDLPLWTWLKQEAERRHCSIGQVVRDLVVAEMGRRK